MYNITMKILGLMLVVLACSVVNATAQGSTDDAKVTAIRDTYKRVNAQIAEMEKAPEYSSIFVTELIVNKNNAPYPAVGIYNSTVRFYYTYGDREKDPYPYRLLKVTVTKRRSLEVESYEYLYSDGGELLFAFEKEAEAESRAYFHRNKLIRMQNGDKVVDAGSNEGIRTASALKAESKRLRAIFTNSN
jgi:hypothetical protein